MYATAKAGLASFSYPDHKNSGASPRRPITPAHVMIFSFGFNHGGVRFPGRVSRVAAVIVSQAKNRPGDPARRKEARAPIRRRRESRRPSRARSSPDPRRSHARQERRRPHWRDETPSGSRRPPGSERRGPSP